MPSTYEPIATTTLGTSATTITFSSIPATYTDLRLVFVGTETTAGANHANLRFNSDSGSNYSRTFLFGSGTAATSSRQTSVTQIRWSITGLSNTVPSTMSADIFSYAGSTNKTCLLTASQDFNGSGVVGNTVGLWRNTAAITSIDIINADSALAAGTTATLYGIKNA
jgi:hypothetical protein